MSVFRPIGCDECCQLDWDGVPAPPCWACQSVESTVRARPAV